MVKSKLIVPIAIICALMGICSTQSASAWIGTGTGGSGGGGSSYGGGWASCNSWSMWSYQIECAGASWAFYEATAATDHDVVFPWAREVPQIGLGDAAKIPSECSRYDGKTGFWHYGPNNLGGVYMSYNGSDLYAGDGWVGHWTTYSRSGYYGSYAQSNYSIPWDKVNTVPHHTFDVYRFDRFGEWSDAVAAYKKVWVYEQHKNGNTGATLADAPSSIPDDVWAFCYGDWAEDVTLTLKADAVTMNGTTLETGISSDKATVSQGSSADLTVRKKDISGYKFVGWRDVASSGSLTTGNTYTKSITEDKTVYAVYVKSYKLSIDQGTGTSISVKRTDSPNARANTGGLTNDAAIYEGDKLTATFGLKTGYSWGTHSFVGKNTNDTSNTSISDHIVGADVTVKTTAVRNNFVGRARASAGTSVGGDVVSTDYVEASKSVSKEVDCVNDGCNVALDLYLKAAQGSGATGYNVGISNNGGSISWIPVTSTMSSVTIANKKSKEIKSGTKKLLPGQNTCYYLRFKPYGKYKDSDTSTVSACIEARVTYFEGKSSVSGATEGAVGWTNKDTTNYFYAENCSSGCKVSFKHELKRANSIGSTGYTVSRTSNLTDSDRKIEKNDKVKTGTFDTDNGVVSSNGVFTLYPGMIVCEKLTFKSSNVTTNNTYTRVCVSALGKAQPDNLEGGASFINILVRNQNVTKYTKYQRTVYAKPKDKLTYRATYNPILQYTYYLKPQQMRIKGGKVYDGGGKTLGVLYNVHKGSSLRNWNNGFSVQLAYNNNFGSSVRDDFTFDAGKSDPQSKTNNYNVATGVLASDVGKTIDERAITNLNSVTQTTPSQVTFTRNGDNNLGNVITDEQSSIATAKVPYNFNTGITITTDNSTPFYAGEEATVKFDVTLKPKKNNETMNSGDKNYATKVGNPKYKIIVYRGSEKGGSDGYGGNNLCSYYGLSEDQVNCGYSKEGNGVFNDSIYTVANMTKSLTRSFNIQDMPAGSQICVAAAFWPASSGVDTNLDKDGSKTWRISDSKCFKIAKKPSMQIWGGNIYSSGNINTAVAAKNHLAISGIDNNSYNVSQKNGSRYVFGAWGELGIVSVGSVKGMASGAYIGYAGNNNGNLTPSYNGSGNGGVKTPGGTTQVDACKRNVLTFANYPCESNAVDGIGNTNSTTDAAKDKSSIIANFAVSRRDESGNDLNLVSGDVRLNTDDKLNAAGAYYYHNDNENLTIPVSTVNAGTLQVVASGKNILINGDIRYSGTYNNINQMPKLVIYAKQNIYIGCNVKNIDAILIADETVVTCATDGFNTDLSENAIKEKIGRGQNSNQLFINGTVIADKLIVNRTFGAATGANSIVSAEIINYDSTNYAWSNWKGNETTVDDMHVTYLKELSPRR